MHRPAAPKPREARHPQRRARSPFVLDDVTFTRSEILNARSDTAGLSTTR
jgi:hypothetical protein